MNDNDSITQDYFMLSYEEIHSAGLLVFAAPRKPFDENELQILDKYLANGGSVLFLSGEGGDKKSGANINAVTKKHGITLNTDSVVRTGKEHTLPGQRDRTEHSDSDGGKQVAAWNRGLMTH